MKKLALILSFTAIHAVANAHETMTLNELMLSFGTDLEKAEVSRETLAPGLHVMFAAGGNVVVSIGDQGVLMVDSQFPEMIPKLKAEIAKLGGDNIDFTINTHSHFDHVDGNPMLGREGSWMIAHINARQQMLSEKTVDLLGRLYMQGPYPLEGLPVVTFDDRMQMFFNGQRIDLLHFGAGHTSGDTVVIFRNDNVVHMGDLFTNSYPFIDTNFGGDLDGLIGFCKSVITNIDEQTKIVPGHGPVMAYDDLVTRVSILETVRERLRALIDRGYSLEQVMEAGPTEEFNATLGDPTLFLQRAYLTLSQ